MTTSSPDTTVRWGILGAGAIAERFARDLSHVPNATLAAVFARRPGAAEALATTHAAKPVTTPEALFAAGIDAVYIATLPDTHHAFARAALEAGLPVLCEKPVTRSLAELDDLLALATARNLLFMEAMKTPFLPLYRALRDHLVAIPAGQGSHATAQAPLGPIAFVQAGNASAHTPPDHPSWRADLAGGALMAIGVYQAFLAVDWLGPALDTQALSQPARTTSATSPSATNPPAINPSATNPSATNPSATSKAAVISTEAQRSGDTPVFPQPTPSVDAFTVVQSCHQRGLSQLYAGLALASPGTATLCGPRGFTTIHKPWWNPSRATIIPLSGPSIELHHPVLGDGLHYETTHFCDLVRAGHTESPIVTHALSRAVMHLLDQARAAIGLEFPAIDSRPPGSSSSEQS